MDGSDRSRCCYATDISHANEIQSRLVGPARQNIEAQQKLFKYKNGTFMDLDRSCLALCFEAVKASSTDTLMGKCAIRYELAGARYQLGAQARPVRATTLAQVCGSHEYSQFGN